MFSEILRSIIADHFLTQAKFAELYGIPVRTIESWCTGSRIPAPYIQEALIFTWKEQTIERMERHPGKYQVQLDHIRPKYYHIKNLPD